MSQISLKGITKSFGLVEVLDDVNLEIVDGELIVFVGPSGCGKTTLLRLIAGLDKPTGGQISIDGKLVNSMPAADRGLAMVFQSYALYPHMSVRQNLAFGLENAKLGRQEINSRIAEATNMLDITPYLERRPGQLSGGQRQRVAIGRAIVRRPTAFLFDEPLSNLDAELRVIMRAELAALHQRLKKTMIYVTHDQIEAMTLASRIVVLRNGRIEQVGTPLELYNNPDNKFVAGFIGAPGMNFLPARVEGEIKGRPSVRVIERYVHVLEDNQTAVETGDNITIGIRPHHFYVAKPGQSGIPVEVVLVEMLGSETLLHTLTDGGQSLLAVFSGQKEARPGDRLELVFAAKNTHAFDENGQRLRARSGE
ncbi:hypothetical protein MNBD_ALPHA12-27 [hydrothermal vent metagenome]|uniref:ABC transporter domain-containing protein n=1 Tax=hydrothermal vent metagenome TaxID=652676 RepID=A0A3B0TI69_9ZZZZ